MNHDNPDSHLTTYRMTLSYDGRPYFGWQRHREHPTIQGLLEGAIESAFGMRSAVQGSGRTDRGAHANGQVATVALAPGLETERALEALNARLPDDIRILEFAEAPPGFHARDAAVSKTYRYVIWNAPACPAAKVGRVWHIPGRLDVAAMRQACPAFLGQLDFASFATRPNFKQATTVRHLQHIDLRAEGPQIEITMRADGFLYKMVRNIVRAIVKVGEGRTSLSQLNQIIAAKNRRAAPGTAPASGLYLDAVAYDPPAIPETEDLPAARFEHQRHKPQTPLSRSRELIVACAPMRSNVNISSIARTASACGVPRLILCGHAKLIQKIARDGADELEIDIRRTLPPVLRSLRADGYRLVGLEQTTNAQNIHDYAFERRSLLVIGNERLGLTDDILAELDDVIEIPVYGLPHSFNAATAAAMALYEYCRQFGSA